MNVVRNDVSPLAALLDAAFGAYADRAALSDGPTRYSYRDLDRMTARLCAILDQKEVPANAPVILLMDRGIQVIVWALAVFRRGGIVCPLDVTLPAETIRAIICKLPDPLVVADYPGGRLRENLASLAAGGTGLLDGSAVEGGTAGGAASFRRHAAGPGDAAYLLCTSGSTGTPKLVQGGQKGLVNYILWQLEAVGAQPGDRFSHLAPVSFDFSFKEWLVPLAGGAEVVVGADALRFDVTSLARWISRNTITVLCCIPFVFRQIVNALQEDSPHAPWLKSCYALPRLLMISGETLHAHPVVAWQRAMGATPALMNLYGPTESTVIKLFNQIPYPYADASESVPLGKAIRGTRVEITDERGEVVPKGVTGQICLVSADLALGYWDEPRLTAEKFVRTGREATPAHATLLTGDYGYLDENENVVYGGRMDFQVKRMGVRIELTGVESALLSIPGIADATVVYTPQPPRIMAYVVAGPGLDQRQVEHKLSAMLPAGQHPDEIVLLQRLPKLVTGKTDRKALERMAVPAGEPPGPPASEADIQHLLASIWGNVLRTDALSLDDNFFETGGDSSKLMEVLGVFREKAGIKLRALDIFTNPTIRSLSRVIHKRPC